MKMSINYKLKGRKWFCLTESAKGELPDGAALVGAGQRHEACLIQPTGPIVHSSQPADVHMFLTWLSAPQCLFSTWECEIMTFHIWLLLLCVLKYSNRYHKEMQKQMDDFYGKLELLEVFLHLKKSFVVWGSYFLNQAPLFHYFFLCLVPSATIIR